MVGELLECRLKSFLLINGHEEPTGSFRVGTGLISKIGEGDFEVDLSSLGIVIKTTDIESLIVEDGSHPAKQICFTVSREIWEVGVADHEGLLNEVGRGAFPLEVRRESFSGSDSEVSQAIASKDVERFSTSFASTIDHGRPAVLRRAGSSFGDKIRAAHDTKYTRIAKEEQENFAKGKVLAIEKARSHPGERGRVTWMETTRQNLMVPEKIPNRQKKFP